MSWRGIDGGIAAARAGHDVVMAPGSHTYFDHYASADTAHEPLAIGGFLPLDTVYAYDPVPAALTADEARHVLGAQGEVLWTPSDLKDYADFRRRLAAHLARLDVLDVNYRPVGN